MTPPPSAADLDAWGLSAEDVAESAPDVWPENAKSVEVFCLMISQWIVGYRGRLMALRLEVLPMIEDHCGVPAADRPGLLRDLLEMQDAALDVINR